jgi:hypothetical protein
MLAYVVFANSIEDVIGNLMRGRGKITGKSNTKENESNDY